MATTVKIYLNKRNPHKYIEVHNDGYYHNSVRQFIKRNGVINMVGDSFLHRWRKENLSELLEDYTLVAGAQRSCIMKLQRGILNGF